MTSRTYQIQETIRGLSSSSDLTYTETICEDGTVWSRAHGIRNDKPVREAHTFKAALPIDWGRLHAARLATGWRLVGEFRAL